MIELAEALAVVYRDIVLRFLWRCLRRDDADFLRQGKKRMPRWPWFLFVLALSATVAVGPIALLLFNSGFNTGNTDAWWAEMEEKKRARQKAALDTLAIERAREPPDPERIIAALAIILDVYQIPGSREERVEALAAADQLLELADETSHRAEWARAHQAAGQLRMPNVYPWFAVLGKMGCEEQVPCMRQSAGHYLAAADSFAILSATGVPSSPEVVAGEGVGWESMRTSALFKISWMLVATGICGKDPQALGKAARILSLPELDPARDDSKLSRDNRSLLWAMQAIIRREEAKTTGDPVAMAEAAALFRKASETALSMQTDQPYLYAKEARGAEREARKMHKRKERS